MRNKIVPLLLLTLTGCSTAYKQEPLSRDHPANPEAGAAPAAPRSHVLNLDLAEPVTEARAARPEPGGHEGMQMSGMKHEGMNMPGMKHDDTKMNSGPTHATHQEPSSAPTIYVCPMHHDVTSDKPNQRCPKCGMKLVPKGGNEK